MNMKKLAVLCLAIPIISLLFIGCNSHENNNDPISDKETGNIISDSLPDGFIVEEKQYTLNNSNYSLVYLKNTTTTDYRLSIKSIVYDNAGKLVSESTDKNTGNFCAGYENHFWLYRGSTEDKDDVEYEAPLTYYYEFILTEFYGEKVNLKGVLSNVYESKRQIQEYVEEGDTKEYPALVGKIDWQCDTDAELFVSAELIIFNENGEIKKTLSLSGFGSVDKLTERVDLYHERSDTLTWPDVLKGEVNHIIAINKAIPFSEFIPQ